MKVILGMQGCSKCHALKEQHPDWKYVEPDMQFLIELGQLTGISSMPIIVTTEDEQ